MDFKKSAQSTLILIVHTVLSLYLLIFLITGLIGRACLYCIYVFWGGIRPRGCQVVVACLAISSTDVTSTLNMHFFPILIVVPYCPGTADRN